MNVIFWACRNALIPAARLTAGEESRKSSRKYTHTHTHIRVHARTRALTLLGNRTRLWSKLGGTCLGVQPIRGLKCHWHELEP